jgi:hypothetical protein
MKKLLLLPIAILLVACESAEASSPETSGLTEAITTIEAISEIRMVPYYSYMTEWDVCEINGEVYENVTFVYTDLGLGYIVENVLYYKNDMKITYCQVAISPEVE